MDEADLTPEEESLLAELEDQDDSEVVDKRTSERA
jgi:hypothetical protein